MRHYFSFRSLLQVLSIPALTLAITSMPLAITSTAHGQVVTHTHALYQSTTTAPAADRDAVISTEDLVKLLQGAKNDQPIILNVGPRLLYAQAHIPGAEYVAPGSSSAATDLLRQRTKAIAHGKLIVLYCGCCPWSHCPNIHPAYEELRSMGFTKVKMLYLANNFGEDWVSKGYPTVKGE